MIGIFPVQTTTKYKEKAPPLPSIRFVPPVPRYVNQTQIQSRALEAY